MDPINPGPDGHGQDGAGDTSGRRRPRVPATVDFVQSAPVFARTVRLVVGDFLLTVNPVDGSEIEICPPQERPARPVKYTAAERAERERAARPPIPPGPSQPRLPLLERQEDRERLVRLLARGRTVRLTGPAGFGRTALADTVAEDCAALAPDGVIRLSGYRRTTGDLLYDIFAAVHKSALYRPKRQELLEYVSDIGAVVVLDDLEFGGDALDELLDATPECAFLLCATPDVPAPTAGTQVEEVLLSGLDQTGGLELLQRAVGRDLTEEERNWAGDLWFESEGLPLRFVQAGALLRQRERQRADESAVGDFGAFHDVPVDAPCEGDDGHDTPLPSLAEAAAPAPLLASRLSPSARETLKFAVALGGEVPHQTHLPALVDDTHADAALAELADCALLCPVGSRYRLAAGVLTQLKAAGYATDAEAYAHRAAQHYAWWSGHPSVAPERVSAEADAVLAALTVLVPLATPPAEAAQNAAVRLARQAATAFAAALNRSAWERALRCGAEASRLAGEVGQQAYFHHELGILALCDGRLDRAQAELETSVGLRGALADKRGTVAGRRALALVADLGGDTPPGLEPPDVVHEEPTTPPVGLGLPAPAGDTATLLTRQESARPADGVRGAVNTTRRNLVAAGAGAALAAVLGTFVALGMTSGKDGNTAPPNQVSVNPSPSRGADEAGTGSGGGAPMVPSPTRPGPEATYGVPGTPTTPGTSPGPSDNPTGQQGSTPPRPPSKPPATSPPGQPSPSKSATPSNSSSQSPEPTDSHSPVPDPSPPTDTNTP